MTSKHTFAFYIPDGLPKTIRTASDTAIRYTIDNPALVHRITRVVRLEPGEILELFDDHYVATACIETLDRKQTLHCIIEALRPIEYQKPAITILLPMLKRDALQEALYACAEIGATEIHLCYTAKTTHTYHEREKTRMHAILIAAAEQSKNYALPTLHAPAPLTTAITAVATTAHRIHLDPAGIPLFALLTRIRETPPDSIALTFGPEGDFTPDEKNLLQSAGFTPCALTQSTLRAQQALVVALGTIRSCLVDVKR